jgi:tetratricopeptide (TPR) repeat protein
VHRYLRLLLVVVALASFLLVIRFAAGYGFARFWGIYALTTRSRTAAEQATRVAPKDAETHFVRAAVLSLTGSPDQAVSELEQAVALRPDDYGLWSELALMRDQLGNRSGALAAFQEAAARAPYYSQPRWNRGNVRLREGDYEGAFDDLNQAAQSNPDLLPALLDLAWGVSRGDLNLTGQLAQISGERRHLAFARFLAGKGKPDEALRQLAAAGEVPEAIRVELVEQLFSKGAFQQAFTIAQGKPPDPSRPTIYDGGFEAALAFDQRGFVWRVPRHLEGVSITLDSHQPDSGAQYLHVEFAGNSNPGTALVSQVVLVAPGRRYQLNFAGRSQDVVAGGLPLLVVSDAAATSKRLGQSRSLEQGTTGWQHYSLEFTATATTTAVLLSLQREGCSTSPCPIFGSVSLDSFSLALLP